METLESLTHFDTKFLNTLRDLVLKPGIVIKNYNSNKRAHYVPPIRMYVFTTFIFLLIVSFLFNHTIEENNETFRKQIMVVKTNGINLYSKTEIDSLTFTKLRHVKNLTNSEINTILKSSNIKTDWFNTRIVNSFIKLQTGDLKISELYKKFVKYASYSFFMFMPFFALILKLFYFRKEYYYSEFLIFSIFYHIFIFGLMGILLLIERLFNINFVYLLIPFFILIFVYLGISLKNVFEGSWPKTIFKTFILSFVYVLCLFCLFIFLILGSMI
ncbi:DUF3667 domain-containing protein [Flavobacterium sp. XS2P12]|uniref:DUF3667 domain-containing protein n=1 Tax=Flavobacterium melibiosi TaxID=3398734 RepID=UPI003A87A4B9